MTRLMSILRTKQGKSVPGKELQAVCQGVQDLV